jgi:hypothetical protein
MGRLTNGSNNAGRSGVGDEKLRVQTAKFPEQFEMTAMAHDRDQGSYHLTPIGWVKGQEPPPDRVETWNYDACPTSGWSKEIFRFDQVWVDEAIGKADRDAMLEKFGIPVTPNKTRDVILIH